MKYLLVILVSVSITVSSKSQTIRGKVVSANNSQPIAGASVFISNTSKGTATNSAGDFMLEEVPAGTHELVISSVGFETYVKSFAAKDLPMELNVRLSLKIQEMEGVTVIPFEKDGWVKWGKVFLENFIGTTSNAANCKIVNYKAIKFRHSKKDDRLTALAMEPLIIQNRAMGYTIRYQLEGFEVDYKNNSMAFYGFPLFESMKGDKKKWRTSRKEAYIGSVNHFIRSTFQNKLKDDGFEVKRLKKVPNYEKERVKTIYKIVQKKVLDPTTKQEVLVVGYNSDQFPKDTAAYFERVLRQKDYFDVYTDYQIGADSIVAYDSLHNKYLLFPDYLAVTFVKEKEDARYLVQIMESNRKPYFQRSTLLLTGSGYVSIEPNGSYYSPQDLYTNGYWGWSEKISNLLPLDYEPEE